MQKTTAGIEEINQKSNEKYKTAKENFGLACKNILKIKKDLESIQKNIAKIKYLNSQKLQPQINEEKAEENNVKNEKSDIKPEEDLPLETTENSEVKTENTPINEEQKT